MKFLYIFLYLFIFIIISNGLPFIKFKSFFSLLNSNSSIKVSLNQILLAKKNLINKYPNYLQKLDNKIKELNLKDDDELIDHLNFSTIWCIKNNNSICFFQIKKNSEYKNDDNYNLTPGNLSNSFDNSKYKYKLIVKQHENIVPIEEDYQEIEYIKKILTNEELYKELSDNSMKDKFNQLNITNNNELSLDILSFTPSIYMISNGILSDQNYLKKLLIHYSQSLLSLFSFSHYSNLNNNNQIDHSKFILNFNKLVSYCSSKLHYSSLFSDSLPLCVTCLFFGEVNDNNNNYNVNNNDNNNKSKIKLIEIDSLGNYSESNWCVFGGLYENFII